MQADLQRVIEDVKSWFVAFVELWHHDITGMTAATVNTGMRDVGTLLGYGAVKVSVSEGKKEATE